jgi:hypothetical protein
MVISNVIAGCGAGMLVGYFDLWLLLNAARNVFQGSGTEARFVRYGFMVRLPIAGVLFYVFIGVFHVGVFGFLFGIALSSTLTILQMIVAAQKLMKREYVSNS